MKGILAATLVLGSSGLALADNQSLSESLQVNGQQTTIRPTTGYQWLDDGVDYPRGSDAVAGGTISNVIYLNNCKSGGCLVKPGNNNSITGTSSIVSSNRTVAAFAYSDTVWANVVQCVRQAYAPFGVVITDQRPASGSYHMAIVGGTPGNIGQPNGVGGISPFACGFIPNAISFTFANIYGPNVDEICNTVAQETAHSWGLDHKYDNRDPMTYLNGGPSRKSFVNEAGSCGEYSARACECNYGTQGKMNSFKEIMDTFGSSTPTPPTAKITAPANGATDLDPEFLIKAELEDDILVVKAELRIDGQLVGTLEKTPWQWKAPESLGQGNHIIEVTAYDVGGSSTKAMVTAALGAPCTSSDMCDQHDVCVDGRCVRGGGVAGGLGTTCTQNEDCASGQCAMDAAGGAFCVETCNPAAEGCPDGFTCIASAGAGICWPGADEGICNVGSQSNGRVAPTFLLLGLAALFITRRRRR